ncbi:MAG: hypothetical protein NTW41_09870 [Verrucomicrobia bacterium]|nr:hypothetical protein [Verrucomicrobiota bacterium]
MKSNIPDFKASLFFETLCIISLLLTGCATHSELKQYYEPEMAGLAHKPVSPSFVRIVDGEWKYEEGIKLTQKLSQEGYWYLGTLEFVGPMQSADSIRKFAASVGGDLVIRLTKFAGMKSGSRMVIGSYTPGSVVTSTASAYGSAYSNGSGVLNSPYGTSYLNTSGSANAYGSGTATTYIPGQTTYVNENYNYPSYTQRYSIMQSEGMFRKNATNFQKYSAAVGKPIPDADLPWFIDQMVKSGKARVFNKKPE